MEIRIRIDAPRGGLRRLCLFVFLPISIILGATVAARALDSSWIVAGQPISALKMKAVLGELGNKVRSCRVGIDGSEGCDWIESVAPSAVGRMAVTFAAGTFSESPHCVCSSTSSTVWCDAASPPSPTTLDVETMTGGGGFFTAGFVLVCVTP